jgi:hypothetical protein
LIGTAISNLCVAGPSGSASFCGLIPSCTQLQQHRRSAPALKPNGNTTIDFGSDTLTLVGVVKANLHADDFIFGS